MTKKIAVGSDQKPTLDQLLEMYEKLDGQMKEIKGQMKRGALTSRHIQALIEHRNPFPKKAEAAELISFKYDKAQDGWTLLEDVSSSGAFTPDFVPFLKPGESGVNGGTMRVRAMELGANLGQRDLEWLEANQHLIPESERGHYLVASGTVWQASGGVRDVPYLYWDGDQWCLDFGWLENGWHGGDRLVSLRK